MTEFENRELLMSLVKAADLDWHKHFDDDGDNRLEHFTSLIISECANALVDHDLWNRHVAHGVALGDFWSWHYRPDLPKGVYNGEKMSGRSW